MTAVYDRKLEACRYLTQISADINIRNGINDTALHLTGYSVIVDIIKLLLDTGISVNLTNKSNTTLLHVSVSCGSLEATTIFSTELLN
jgi:ankyrin repeat protein